VKSGDDQSCQQRIIELQIQLNQRDQRIAELERQLIELIKANEILAQKNAELTEQLRQLSEKVARLSKNSSNSSKPPSSDIVKPPKGAGPRPGKKRKIGAQPGHPRHVRELFPREDIDQFHEYRLPCCPECNGAVVLCEDQTPRVVQQMEIVEVPVIKHEHRSYAVWCPQCEKIHYMAFPAEVVKQGLFKERLTALVAYMKHVCHASFSTIRKYIRDVLGQKVSRGYLRKLIHKVSLALEGPYEQLLKLLPLETVVNVDETGHKDNGNRFWTWVFKAELYVLFRIDKHRSSEVLLEVLGAEFDGVLGCDYFSAYRKYMKDCDISIQFCLAHLIRDIRFLIGFPDQQTQAYAQRLLAAVRQLFRIIHEKESMSSPVFQSAMERAKANILHVATHNVPSCIDKDGKELRRHAHNMANRFRKHGEAYFTFITTPGMDPTNNVAEQAIRFVVIDRHVTQGTRSAAGRQASERLWTVIATCRLQGRSAFNFILEAVRAYFCGRPAPSLLPSPT